jgi:hypothetical protein
MKRRKGMKDPVLTDEAKYDRDCQKAEAKRQKLIGIAMDTVWEEVKFGEHDAEIANSSWIDSAGMARVACQVAMNNAYPDVHAMNDLSLQLEDYVRDVAERRVDA